MILHHRLPQLKHRVLMVRVVYLHPIPRLQPLVRLLLFAEEKDVDIPRRAMLRHRPCERQPIPLQKQHTHPHLGIESSKTRYHLPVVFIHPLHAHHHSHPLQHHLLRRTLPSGKFLDHVKDDTSHPLAESPLLVLPPVDVGRQVHNLLPHRHPQQEQQCPVVISHDTRS